MLSKGPSPVQAHTVLYGWWYPDFTPQVMIHFSRKIPMGLLGKPTILGFTPIWEIPLNFMLDSANLS